MAAYRIADLPEHIQNKIMPVTECGCWIWIGARIAGYGSVWVGDKKTGRSCRAHRHIYTLLRGPIADGLVTDHLCRTPSCVNPAHLELVPIRVNVQRGYRSFRTHCRNGHPFSEDNTVITTGKFGYPWRKCRRCNADAVKRNQRGKPSGRAKHNQWVRRRRRQRRLVTIALRHPPMIQHHGIAFWLLLPFIPADQPLPFRAV